jgi:hypothetical protein
MSWIVWIVVVLVLLPLWQIAISIVPIGEYFKHRNAAIEDRETEERWDAIHEEASRHEG